MSESASRQTRMLDFRIPLWSVIMTCGTFVFSTGGLYVKLQNVQSSLVMIEAKSDKRDAADEEMYRQIDRVSGRFDVFDMRISRNAQDISDIKSQVHDLSTAVTLRKDGP